MKERFNVIRQYVEKFEDIADLGIGKGYYYAGGNFPKVVGVDISSHNLRVLKEHNPEIITHERDISDTGLLDKSFDLVICTQVLEHIENYEPALKEMKRICKSGGYFLIGLPIDLPEKLHFHPTWTEESLKELGEKLGDIITIKKYDIWWLLYVRNVEVPDGTEDYSEVSEEIKEHVSIIFVHWSQDAERSAISKASLKSLQATIHTPAEIIVVDNGDNIEDSKFFLDEVHNKRIALYIRNADNMHCTYARNQAMPEITGKWVVIVDNDIIYKDYWLELGIKCIKQFPDKKLIASPINYPYVHKRDPRWRHGQLEIKGRHFNLTERSGDNCRIMKRETFDEIGKFGLSSRKASAFYTDKLVEKGYLVITPALNWAFDAGFRRGFLHGKSRELSPFNKEFIIKRTLSNGENINLN